MAQRAGGDTQRPSLLERVVRLLLEADASRDGQPVIARHGRRHASHISARGGGDKIADRRAVDDWVHQADRLRCAVAVQQLDTRGVVAGDDERCCLARTQLEEEMVRRIVQVLQSHLLEHARPGPVTATGAV